MLEKNIDLNKKTIRKILYPVNLFFDWMLSAKRNNDLGVILTELDKIKG